MSAENARHWLGEPFVMGTAEQFSQLRELLQRIDFSETALCAGVGVERLSEMKFAGKRTIGFLVPDTPQALAVRLFLDGDAVPWEVVRGVFAPDDIATLQALGLIQDSVLDPAACVGTVAIYPLDGLYIVSDRNTGLKHVATSASPSDVVYSAISRETTRFLKFMPRIHSDDYLELCSGAAPAALIAARDFATQATAIDITERSTRFAVFNAALNEITNVEALAGDLYDPAHGRTFDVITAHPPYIPALENELVFRDGGADGEQITRRIIETLPRYLRPGGIFFCDCFMTDREDAPVEARIRAMLGLAEHEFHILVAEVRVIPASRFVGTNVASGQLSPAQADMQLAQLSKLGVTQFVDGLFLIERRSTAGPSVTRRRVLSEHTDASHLQQYMALAVALEELAADPAAVLTMYPRCSPHTELLSRSALRDGRWTMTASSFVSQAPFAMEADVPPWFGTLLSWCDGHSTVRDLLVRLQNAAIVPNGFPAANFAALIIQLADGGFIELQADKDTIVA